MDYEDKVDNQLKECQNYTVNEGLYTAIYLNETMNVDQLVESGKDKADAVRSGLKKLIEKQYIKKSVVREKNGNFVTVYYQVIE